MQDQLSGNSGKGLVRRKELNEMFSQLTDQKRPKISRSTHCFVQNSVGSDLDGFSVVQISGTHRDPESAQDLSLATTFALDGVAVSADDETRVAIIQTPLQQSSIGQAVYAGVSVVRLVGPTGQQYATTKSGDSTLTAAASGPFEILYDEGDTVGSVERYAVVRIGSGTDGTDGTDGTNGQDGNCPCGCSPIGSIDHAGHQWSENYLLNMSAFAEPVQVTWQGDGIWESALIDFTCTIDEVEVIDQYRVTMTAIDVTDITIDVVMEVGGGYSGEAACCDRAEGFAQRYIVPHVVDPLCVFPVVRDPRGFQGRECQIGDCKMCVEPYLDNFCVGVDQYLVTFASDGDGAYEVLNGASEVVKGFGKSEGVDTCCDWQLFANDEFHGVTFNRGLPGEYIEQSDNCGDASSPEQTGGGVIYGPSLLHIGLIMGREGDGDVDVTLNVYFNDDQFNGWAGNYVVTGIPISQIPKSTTDPALTIPIDPAHTGGPYEVGTFVGDNQPTSVTIKVLP